MVGGVGRSLNDPSPDDDEAADASSGETATPSRASSGKEAKPVFPGVGQILNQPTTYLEPLPWQIELLDLSVDKPHTMLATPRRTPSATKSDTPLHPFAPGGKLSARDVMASAEEMFPIAPASDATPHIAAARTTCTRRTCSCPLSTNSARCWRKKPRGLYSRGPSALRSLPCGEGNSNVNRPRLWLYYHDGWCYEVETERGPVVTQYHFYFPPNMPRSTRDIIKARWAGLRMR